MKTGQDLINSYTKLEDEINEIQQVIDDLAADKFSNVENYLERKLNEVKQDKYDFLNKQFRGE
jgi:hypothetical protein